MKSMTGYGRMTSQSESLSLEISLRTVNGRFLETRFHLPREYAPFEAELKKLLQEKILRGTVDIYIARKVRGLADGAELVVNKELAKAYLKSYTELAKALKIKFQPHLETFAKLPDVIRADEVSDVSKKEQALLVKTFKGALDKCLKERAREGQSLVEDLSQNLSSLRDHIEAISSLREEVNEQLQAKLEQKIQARLKSVDLDPARVAQEVVFQIEKGDINEELQRLQEHLKNYSNMIKSSVVEGKKLDFYTQELLREVNTIGSKSQVARITQSVVEAKTIIERLREQVQNVE